MVEAEPVRAQRNETALRWFLVFLLEPADRQAVLEREWEYVTHEAEGRRAVHGRARRRAAAAARSARCSISPSGWTR